VLCFIDLFLAYSMALFSVSIASHRCLIGSTNKLGEKSYKRVNFVSLKHTILNKDLAKYLLPRAILDFFEIVADTIENDRVHFYLEEKNIIPEEYQSEKSQSKRFLSRDYR
jgi:hypothetical protein